MLTSRWSILALLFTVRTGMGFQFQVVPALSPLFIDGFAVSVADIGLLIGLFYAPGLFLALPGGAIGQRFGDKQVVMLGLVLMIAGGLVMALLPSWQMQLAGRLVAGVGGILLNVLMSKMVTDWFAGKEIATAMGIFVNSWPFGVALGLVTLPSIAAAGGLAWASLAVTAYLAVMLIALGWLYQAPPIAAAVAAAGAAARPAGWALAAVLTAGLAWGLYNAGLAMIFGFGPLMLSERGWSIAQASSATSIVMWLVAVSVPLGGVLADRTGRPLTVLAGGLVAFALTLVLAARVDAVLAAFIVLGLVSGLPAGPIMSLPSRVLAPQSRAIGMGLFFTVFYALQVSAPWLAGAAAKAAGSARTAFDLGAAFLALCLAAVFFFRWLAVRVGGMQILTPVTAPAR